MITDYFAGLLSGVVISLIVIIMYEYIEMYFNNRHK